MQVALTSWDVSESVKDEMHLRAINLYLLGPHMAIVIRECRL